jgi:hypothetical protein
MTPNRKHIILPERLLFSRQLLLSLVHVPLHSQLDFAQLKFMLLNGCP